MKKLKMIYSMFLLIAVTSFNGCDEFESIPINIPISITVETQHTNSTSTSGSSSYCLENSAAYQQYMDDINSLIYVEASWRTAEVVPASLSGVVTIVLKNSSGNILFSYSLGNITPADYIENPLQIQLSETEIDLINLFLSSNQDLCMTAEVLVEQMPGGQVQYVIGIIDLLFEADANLD